MVAWSYVHRFFDMPLLQNVLSNSLHLECRQNLVPYFLLESPTLEEASCHLVRILEWPEDESQQEQDLSYNWILQCQSSFQTVAVPANILTTCSSETLSLATPESLTHRIYKHKIVGFKKNFLFVFFIFGCAESLLLHGLFSS